MDLAKQIRSDIVDILAKVDNVNMLKIIRRELELMHQKFSTKIDDQTKQPLFISGVKAVREKISLEELMKEQHYQPINYQKFRLLADEIEWQESLDELLAAAK